MNLYLRLIWTYIRSWFQTRASIFDTFVSEQRVWPSDLDLLGHMNNGRYFTITDYVRLEVLIRSGLWTKMRKLGYYPVLAGETAQFRKPLLPFQRYQVSTRMVGWDEKFFYVEHTFISARAVNALALMKICVIGPNNARPRPVDILRMAEPTAGETFLEPTTELWNQFQGTQWKEYHRLESRQDFSRAG